MCHKVLEITQGVLNVFRRVTYTLSEILLLFLLFYSLYTYIYFLLDYFVTVNCFTQSHGLEMSREGVKM